MESIENFLSQYPATISTVAAASTVAAVVVALYLARKRYRSNLKIFANINRYISSEKQDRSSTIDLEKHPLFISLTINNVGPVAVSISYWSSFGWRVIGSKQIAMQNPAEPDFRNQPIELLPGKSATIVLSKDLIGYKDMMKKLADSSWLGPWSLRFPQLIVKTEIGESFRAKIGKSLRKYTLGKDFLQAHN
ncbi:MAG: hypothetical protein OXF89_17290 [Rhodospirillaceae bacterium]|nr:hypothetical protein [Rhodospirillaceae bacterium]